MTLFDFCKVIRVATERKHVPSVYAIQSVHFSLHWRVTWHFSVVNEKWTFIDGTTRVTAKILVRIRCGTW